VWELERAFRELLKMSSGAVISISEVASGVEIYGFSQLRKVSFQSRPFFFTRFCTRPSPPSSKSYPETLISLTVFLFKQIYLSIMPPNSRSQTKSNATKRGPQDANVNGKGDASPLAKKRKAETSSISSTTAPVPPPVVIKANPDHDAHTYIKFGSLPPSPEVKAKLDGLLNDVPISSLIDANVAQLFDNVEVFSIVS